MVDMIRIKDVTKIYNKKKVVQQLDLTIKKGELFAFLGPNGAGKSTTINMIATAIKPTSGTIFVGDYQVGKDNLAIRKEIGIVFQENILDDLLTVEENLNFWGKAYGLSKIEISQQILLLKELLNLDGILMKRFGTLSGGQKRRGEIARAILHNPSLLILDEPTTGLDPETRIHVWKTMRHLRKNSGMTIFLTTHYMEEAAEADHLAIFQEGKLKVLGTPSDIKSHYAKDFMKLYAKNLFPLEKFLEIQERQYEAGNDHVKTIVEDKDSALSLLNEAKHYYESFEVHKGNLDDVFLEVVKKEKEK